MRTSYKVAAAVLALLSVAARAGTQSEVGLIELQSNPLAYRGRKVTVAGYLTYSSKDILFGMLSLDPEQNAHEEGILVWPQSRMVRDHEKCNAMFVKLTGEVAVSQYLPRGPLERLGYPQIVAQACVPWSDPNRPRFRQQTRRSSPAAAPGTDPHATEQRPIAPPERPIGLVSFVELRGDPMLFNGKRIVLRGYLRIVPSTQAGESSATLYLDRTDAENQLGNEIQIIPSGAMLRSAGGIDNQYVQIQGVVQATQGGVDPGTAVAVRVDQQDSACTLWPRK